MGPSVSVLFNSVIVVAGSSVAVVDISVSSICLAAAFSICLCISFICRTSSCFSATSRSFLLLRRTSASFSLGTNCKTTATNTHFNI